MTNEKNTTIEKLMKIKQDYPKIGLVLTALALLSLARPAMAQEQVPFKGVEVGSDSSVSFEFPMATISCSSQGEATYLVPCTVTSTLLVNMLPSITTATL